MSPLTLFFYDLETSGFNPREARIMQFAGQRTDLELKPIGEPVNALIKLTPDILPQPDAVLITGITPQQTLADGLSEAEFLKLFENEVALPGTIFLGYNTVRFDDEFMRCLHYRNFYDPYEWQWQENRSRWDLLDVVRMTRALRPDGIEWPFDLHGKPTNRLELITGLNKLSHEHAHDALSDVMASIEVARLIQNKQTKLFEYLFTMRDKKKVAALVTAGEPFVYTSGQYPSEFDKTTVAFMLCPHPKKQGALVFDLREDPTAWLTKSPEELAEAWKYKKDKTAPRLPVKVLQFNKCPAVAPFGVLDNASQQRLQLDLKVIKRHQMILEQAKDWPEKLCQVLGIMEKQFQTALITDERDVDKSIYDGFYDAQDKQALRVVRAASPSDLDNLGLKFNDRRLDKLLPLYKARNFSESLSGDEWESWEKFRSQKLLVGGQSSPMAKYLNRLQQILADDELTSHQQYLIEELKLYAESIMPDISA